MTLIEFLSTANADDSLALAEAKAHVESSEKMISSDLMAMILVDFKLYDLFKASDEEAIHAFMDRVLTSSEFNFYEPSTAGAANFKLLDSLINDPVLRATLTAVGMETTNPFASINLYDVKRERNTLTDVEISVQGAHSTIITTDDCEKHSVIIEGVNPRTEKRERVATINNVSTAGKYDVFIKPDWRMGIKLFALDAYGVIS
jgi:hypothetical protein